MRITESDIVIFISWNRSNNDFEMKRVDVTRKMISFANNGQIGRFRPLRTIAHVRACMCVNVHVRVYIVKNLIR